MEVAVDDRAGAVALIRRVESVAHRALLLHRLRQQLRRLKPPHVGSIALVIDERFRDHTAGLGQDGTKRGARRLRLIQQHLRRQHRVLSPHGTAHLLVSELRLCVRSRRLRSRRLCVGGGRLCGFGLRDERGLCVFILARISFRHRFLRRRRCGSGGGCRRLQRGGGRCALGIRARCELLELDQALNLTSQPWRRRGLLRRRLPTRLDTQGEGCWGGVHGERPLINSEWVRNLLVPTGSYWTDRDREVHREDRPGPLAGPGRRTRPAAGSDLTNLSRVGG